MSSLLRRCAALCALLLLSTTVHTSVDQACAQPTLTTPRVSPHAQVMQRVGLTDITVDYHRPSARGREVAGGLMPYGQVWRTGANENTTVTFSTPVLVEGQPLAAGTYGLHTIPGEATWTVIFSRNHWSWGSFNYDESEDALRVTVTPEQADFLETMQFSFPAVSSDATTLALRWGEIMVPVQVGVDLHETVFANMRREFDTLQGFFPQNYAQAAAYAAQNDVNHEEAMAWIDRAIAQQPTFANQGVKAMLLHRMGQSDEADALVAEALPSATEAEVNTFGYGLMNMGLMERAGAMFAHNVETHPASWNVHDSYGEWHANMGETAEAIAHYERALEMAPPNQQARIEGILAGLREAQ